MRQGVAPPRNASAVNGGKLILLHGYCADKNPFAVYPADWSDAIYFLRPKVSMPHDEYAQRVVQFAADNGLSSYGLVGHSQGGIVTLHSLNYYHTGLDNAVGARKIQSLASPYRGNSVAGSTADIGAVKIHCLSSHSTLSFHPIVFLCTFSLCRCLALAVAPTMT